MLKLAHTLQLPVSRRGKEMGKSSSRRELRGGGVTCAGPCVEQGEGERDWACCV